MQAAGTTPGGALPSIPWSFRLAIILLPEPRDFDFSWGADGVVEVMTTILSSAELLGETRRVSDRLRPPNFRSRSGRASLAAAFQVVCVGPSGGESVAKKL